MCSTLPSNPDYITLALSCALALSIAITLTLALTRLRPGAQRYLRVRRRVRPGGAHHLRRCAYRIRRAHLDPTRTLRRPPAAHQRAVGQLRGASSHRVAALVHRVAAASTSGDSLHHIGHVLHHLGLTPPSHMHIAAGAAARLHGAHPVRPSTVDGRLPDEPRQHAALLRRAAPVAHGAQPAVPVRGPLY